MTLTEQFEMFGLTLEARPYGQQTWYKIFEDGELICSCYNEQQASLFLIGYIRGTTKGKVHAAN